MALASLLACAGAVRGVDVAGSARAGGEMGLINALLSLIGSSSHAWLLDLACGVLATLQEDLWTTARAARDRP